MGVIAGFLQTLGLEDIATLLLGWDTKTQYISAAAAAYVVYGCVFVICQILYNISKLLPEPWRQITQELIKTTSLCAYPFGHGMLRKYYGEAGYWSGAIPMVTLTLLSFPEADGNPVTTWIKYFSKVTSLTKCLTKTIIQICATLAAYRLGMLVFNLELHPVYLDRLKNYTNNVCSSTLNVPVYLGFLAEMCGVLYVTWFFSVKLVNNVVWDTLIKVTNASLVVSSGVHLTGMFLHPAIATCHTFGCGNTPRMFHILVYWMGPLVGAWLSVQVQSRFNAKQGQSPNIKSEYTKTENLNSGNTNWDRSSETEALKRRKKFFNS